MTVVYLDSVFILNTVMNYILLLATARLAGLVLQRRRYLIAAVLGGLYAVAVFFPGVEVLAHPIIKITMGVFLSLMAFGREEKLLRLILLFFTVSCAMAGAVLGLGFLADRSMPVAKGIFFTDVDEKILLIAAAAFYLLWNFVFQATAKSMIEGTVLPIQVCIAGKSAKLTALWDSGNNLRDSISGQNILVLAPESFDMLFRSSIQSLLTKDRLQNSVELLEMLRQKAPELRPRLISYRAVGVTTGLLVVITTDWVEIGGNIYRSLPAALSPTGFCADYTALWGGEVGKGNHHGMVENIADKFETAAKTGDSLHRRQRYTSSAFDQRTGGGTAWTTGGRMRSERAD